MIITKRISCIDQPRHGIPRLVRPCADGHKLFEISAPSDFDALADHLPDCYEPEFVIAQLKVGIDARCKRVIVEDYYNDKDYRSTYYHYYTKKGYRYAATCMHDDKRAYVCDRGGDQEHLQVALQGPAGAPLSRMPGNLETH